jgi:capsular polysaccharide biosynthesis protein
VSVAQSESRAVVFSRRVYRLLLAAYPRAHRKEYGGPMEQLFRDQCRDAWQRRRIWGVLGLWLRVLPDLLKTAIWERLTSPRERKYMFQKTFAEIRAHPAWLGIFVAIFVTVFVLVALTATIVTFILPEAYASKARIKVEPPPVNVAGQPASTGNYDPYFIQTEFAVMQSEKILDRVIERLDLNTVWQAKYNFPQKLKTSESRELLRRMIEVRPARNTSLIDITAYSDDKAEAAKIANVLAEVFVNYRREQCQVLIARSADEYKNLIDELKKDLTVKTDNPKADDDKIAKMIARAAQTYMASNGAGDGLGAEIIEHAEPGFRPVRPNKPLNIALGIVIGAVAGFVIAGGVVLLGIMLRKPRAVTPAQSLA